MRWLKEQVGRSARPRTVALAALLIVTLVWAGSQTVPRKREAPRPAARAAATGMGSARDNTKGTSPQGWGRDPFDPERPGSTHRR